MGISYKMFSEGYFSSAVTFLHISSEIKLPSHHHTVYTLNVPYYTRSVPFGSFLMNLLSRTLLQFCIKIIFPRPSLTSSPSPSFLNQSYVSFRINLSINSYLKQLFRKSVRIPLNP